MAPFYEVETNIIARVSKERKLSCGDAVHFSKRDMTIFGSFSRFEIIVQILDDDLIRVLRDEGDGRTVEISEPGSSYGVISSPRYRINGLCQEIYRQNIFVDKQGLRARRVEWREK